MRIGSALSGLLMVALACSSLRAQAHEVYEVGPGRPYDSIGAVPWEALLPGDSVRIHWRPQAYREKWVIGRRGAPNAWITVRGVAGPLGQLPVIDGRDATTRSALNYWNENRGVIKIGGSNSPPDTTPAWIRIENLDIRSGRSPYFFFGRNGRSAYADNAAAIYVEKGEQLQFRNCVFRDCGNGLFTSWLSKDVLVESCAIYDNGIENSIFQHNSYTECQGIVYQFNHFGPLRANCPGNNLKDRSAGTVIRYNWIEAGNRQLDLVESGQAALYQSPAYRETFVYGNVLIEPDGAGNSQICHYGGDNGTTSRYRKGRLYFHHNTVVSTRSGNTTLLRLSTADETADVRNNILYVTASGDRLAMLDRDGVLDLHHNWTKPGWRSSHGSFQGVIRNHGGAVTGDEPGFLDALRGEFRLRRNSACRNAGTDLAPACLPDHLPRWEYIRNRSLQRRFDARRPDLGAFAHGLGWHRD